VNDLAGRNGHPCRSVDVMAQVDVVDTGSPWIVSRSLVIDAPAAQIFDILADPRRHAAFDGSGSVKGSVSAPQRLSLGAKFGMDMRLGVPYRISNRVKEFEEGRRIAWAHMGGHRWRYELDPLPDGATRVTETFDATTARSARALKLMDAYGRNARAIEETLPRLAALAESEAAAT
jgi:uncharacterized protein YndB with AHSA1/START domain